MFDLGSFFTGILIGMLAFGVGGKLAYALFIAGMKKRRTNPYAIPEE